MRFVKHFQRENPQGKVFVTSGLGGMSGAQPKAGNIAGCITVCAEVNAVAAHKRHQQGWVDELIDNMPSLLSRTKQAIEQQEVVSIAYVGNIVEVWESFMKTIFLLPSVLTKLLYTILGQAVIIQQDYLLKQQTK
jgi:urocanate hydratase